MQWNHHAMTTSLDDNITWWQRHKMTPSQDDNITWCQRHAMTMSCNDNVTWWQRHARTYHAMTISHTQNIEMSWSFSREPDVIWSQKSHKVYIRKSIMKIPKNSQCPPVILNTPKYVLEKIQTAGNLIIMQERVFVSQTICLSRLGRHCRNAGGGRWRQYGGNKI